MSAGDRLNRGFRFGATSADGATVSFDVVHIERPRPLWVPPPLPLPAQALMAPIREAFECARARARAQCAPLLWLNEYPEISNYYPGDDFVFDYDFIEVDGDGSISSAFVDDDGWDDDGWDGPTQAPSEHGPGPDAMRWTPEMADEEMAEWNRILH